MERAATGSLSAHFLKHLFILVHFGISPLKYLDGYPWIKYQFVLKFENGETFNLAPEGTIRNLPGHTWKENESESDKP